MKKIIWLASYPKSGNTWFRAFLSNMRQNADTPVSINALDGAAANSRDLFDDVAGIESSDLTPLEIERLFPAVFERIAARSDEKLFFKIHDAYTHTCDGRPLSPDRATQGAIYFLRNPLDVAVSFAHHEGKTLDAAIDQMAEDNAALADKTDRFYPILRQKLLTWSNHVQGWIDRPPFPVHLMRYEDMTQIPLETFVSAARFIGLPDDPARIQKALQFSTFEELQHQEQAHGFTGRASKAPSFFRKGQVGSWRTSLSETQVKRILSDHGHVMRRFDYLRADGTPVF